jgi:uncharacterized membrane protein YcaP (DUF421 family)
VRPAAEKAVCVWRLAVPAWQIAARTALVYLALLAGLRLTGKREVGQMTVFDLVVLLVLSNAVQNAMLGPDTSLTGGLLAAACLLALNRLVAALRLRSPRLRELVEGSPTVLVSDGQYHEDAMRREGVDRAEVEMALREHGIAGVEAVRLAVLEPDGSISVVPQETPVVRVRRHRRFIKKP